jgi:hypothetical protein
MSCDELERLGAAAHSRVVDRHAIDTEAGKLAGLFRNLDAPA